MQTGTIGCARPPVSGPALFEQRPGNGVAYQDACGAVGPRRVGTFQPNAFGLYDMIGNVGEWLEGPYAPGDPRMAIIGSSWRSDLASLGGRGGALPHERGNDTGIRVARDR